MLVRYHHHCRLASLIDFTFTDILATLLACSWLKRTTGSQGNRIHL